MCSELQPELELWVHAWDLMWCAVSARGTMAMDCDVILDRSTDPSIATQNTMATRYTRLPHEPAPLDQISIN